MLTYTLDAEDRLVFRVHARQSCVSQVPDVNPRHNTELLVNVLSSIAIVAITIEPRALDFFIVEVVTHIGCVRLQAS